MSISPKSRIIVVLPVYNEGVTLGELLEDLATELLRTGRPYQLIAVNDGSTDESSEIIARYQACLPIERIDHPQNRGLAATVRAGLTRATSGADPADVIIRMDADTTQHPRYIHALLDRLDQGYDVVIASRFAAGASQAGVSLGRRLLSWGALAVFKLSFPTPGVWDYTSGYRAYRAGPLQRALQTYGQDFIEFGHLGFAATAEKLIKLRALGARIAEIPFDLRYDRKQSVSKMHAVWTTVGSLALVGKYGFRSRAACELTARRS